VVHIENSVVADNRQIFNLRLRDQHPIEGVAVLTAKSTCPNRMR
jgi:hypothetical protein